MDDTKTLLSLRQQVLEREFSRMNQRQQQAVFATEGPVLVLAGAGSGKTTVLVNRIANLIRYGNAYHSAFLSPSLTPQDQAACQSFLLGEAPLPELTRARLAVDPCPPWRVMAITFTNKAAGELKDRLCQMLGQDGDGVWASTFHSSCARILRRDGDRLGYTSHFTIYDTDDSRRLMKNVMQDLDIQEKALSHRAILGEISGPRTQLIGPGEYQDQAGEDFRLKLVARAYQA